MADVAPNTPENSFWNSALNDAPLEDQLLGGLLHAAESGAPHAKELIERTNESTFRIPANRLIHTVLRDLFSTVGSADVISAARHLASNKQLSDAGGYSRFAYLWSCACAPEVLSAFVQLFVGGE